MLTKKQTSYTIIIPTIPYFSFNDQTDLVDFDDVLRDILKLETRILQQLHDYIIYELQPNHHRLGRNTESATEEIKDIVDVHYTMREIEINHYFHFRCIVQTVPPKSSAPILFISLNQGFIDDRSRYTVLPPLSVKNPEITSQQIDLHNLAHTRLANNYCYESGLRIKKGEVSLEFAEYGEPPLLTNLRKEMLGLLSLIIILNKVSSGLPIEVSIVLQSNTQLIFNSRDSIVHTNPLVNTFTLSDGSLQVTEKLADIRTSTLQNLLQSILHSLVGEVSPFLPAPFIAIDEKRIAWEIENLKKHIK